MLQQRRIIPILFALFFNLATANAAVSPLSVSVLPPVQFPPEDFTVTGARASVLWGRHHAIYGLDLGLIGNITTQNFVGVAASGIFNITNGNTNIIGLQFAGITNVNTNKTSVYGLQFAGILNSNTAESKVVGLQVSLINLADHTKIYGIQAGIYNHAIEVYGLQIGIVNVTENLHGVQIGLINFNHKGVFAVAPILNVGF
jgi:hypothetical protein